MAGSETDLAQAATDLIGASNEADWERFRGLLASDAVYAETGTGRRVEGADAYLQLVQAWKNAFPDVIGTVNQTILSGDTVAQELRWDGTHTGPLQTPAGPLEPTGRRISTEASLWSRFEDGLVREVHHYLDVMMLLQQLGAIPTDSAA